MQASAEAVAQRAKEALEHTISSVEPAINEVIYNITFCGKDAG